MRIIDWSSDVCSSDLPIAENSMSDNASSAAKPRQFAIFGHPVAHSLSPRIHQAFARQQGLSIEYRAVDVAPAALSAALDAFAAAGGVGATITLPHKEAAFALCAARSDRAARAGSVNTLTRVRSEEHTSELQSLMRISYA